MKHSDQYQSKNRLAAVLLIWVLAACIVPNIWLSLTEPLTNVQALANILLPAGIYALLMSLSRHIGRSSLWMITVMFFAAFQIVLLYMYGRSIIAVDMFLNIVTTNPDEVGELLGNMFPIIAAIIIIYLTPISFSIVAVAGKWRLTRHTQSVTRRSGIILSLCGLILVGCSFFSSRHYYMLTDLYPVNVLYNVGLAVDRTKRLASYPETSSEYTFGATTSRLDSVAEIYVAVIGETSRADNWQLFGYHRPTTPELTRRSNLVGFSKALSQSNTTHKSVPMLLSALDASDFGDSIYTSKSFITAFREAGFKTAFISNQNRNHSFIDRFGEEADTCIFIRELTANTINGHYDTDLLEYIDRQIADGGSRQLIVVHTYGSHFNYIDRYPQENAQFTPDGPADAIKAFRNEQLNAYDNTISLTSRLLSSIMDRLELSGKRAALIYTSDHGEDIFDDERNLFLHASPCPSFYQIHVPFLIWTSSNFNEAYPDLLNNATINSEKFVASSKAYFHTLMEIAGIESPRVRPSASLVNASYTPEQPVYLNDHNRPVTLRESGLMAPDFHKLDSIGVSYTDLN